MKRRSAPLYGPYGLGRTLRFLRYELVVLNRYVCHVSSCVRHTYIAVLFSQDVRFINDIEHCRRDREAIAPPPKFWVVGELWDNFVLEGKLSSNSAKFGVKSPILGKFKGKIEILSTHNLFRRKFAAVCLKVQPFLPCLLF